VQSNVTKIIIYKQSIAFLIASPYKIINKFYGCTERHLNLNCLNVYGASSPLPEGASINGLLFEGYYCYVDPDGYLHLIIDSYVYPPPTEENPQFRSYLLVADLIYELNLNLVAAHLADSTKHAVFFKSYRTMKKVISPISGLPSAILISSLSLGRDSTLSEISWDTVKIGKGFNTISVVKVDENDNIYVKASRKDTFYYLKLSPEGELLGALPIPRDWEVRINLEGVLYASYIEKNNFYVFKYPYWPKTNLGK